MRKKTKGHEMVMLRTVAASVSNPYKVILSTHSLLEDYHDILITMLKNNLIYII